jgi:hypothetical protein
MNCYMMMNERMIIYYYERRMASKGNIMRILMKVKKFWNIKMEVKIENKEKWLNWWWIKIMLKCDVIWRIIKKRRYVVSLCDGNLSSISNNDCSDNNNLNNKNNSLNTNISNPNSPLYHQPPPPFSLQKKTEKIFSY